MDCVKCFRFFNNTNFRRFSRHRADARDWNVIIGMLAAGRFDDRMVYSFLIKKNKKKQRPWCNFIFMRDFCLLSVSVEFVASTLVNEKKMQTFV